MCYDHEQLEKIRKQFRDIGKGDILSSLNPTELLKLSHEYNEAGIFDRYYSCERKNKYATRWLATLAAYRQDEISNNPKIKGVDKGRKYTPYKCDYCEFYHIGRIRFDKPRKRN